MTGQAVVHTDGTTQQQTAEWQPLTGARHCEQGHIDMEPEGPHERWPEWNLRRDDHRVGEEAIRAYRAGG